MGFGVGLGRVFGKVSSLKTECGQQAAQQGGRFGALAKFDHARFRFVELNRFQPFNGRRVRAEKADMAQRPFARCGIGGGVGLVKAGRHLFVAPLAHLLGKGRVHLGKVCQQAAVLCFQAAYPAVGGRVGFRVADDYRCFVRGRVVGCRRRRQVVGTDGDAPAVVVGVRAGAEDFKKFGHTKSPIGVMGRFSYGGIIQSFNTL